MFAASTAGCETVATRHTERGAPGATVSAYDGPESRVSGLGDVAPGSADPPARGAAKPPARSAEPAIPRATGDVSDRFGLESTNDGDPAALYLAGRPSGVIVLLPNDFQNRVAPLGEGLTASKSDDAHVALAALSFRISPRRAADELDTSALAAACSGVLLRNPRWEPWTDVSWGPKRTHGRVWRGKGEYGGGSARRYAYVLKTAVDGRDIIACAAWNASAPELETRVIAILTSFRVGAAPPADIYGE